MKSVIAKACFCNNSESIAFYFQKDIEIEYIIKSIPGIKWCTINNCWYIPFDKSLFIKCVHIISAYATVDYQQLKEYLNKRQEIVSMKNFEKRNHKEVSINNRTLASFNVSEAKVHTTLNALKFYFEQVLHKQKMFFEIPRPKKPVKLPTVHAAKRVQSIIERTTDIKHRCMLMLAYGAGMRVSEIADLQITDIVSDRMIIHIKRAKGKKDRIVSLSEKLLLDLREYYKIYKPKKYLFEGIGGEQYSIRSVQKVFEQAKLKAGVRQKGGIHSMRHSYATHLLEQGTDIRIIQQLLGHNNLKTTERYTHISVKVIEKVQSPLDRLKWQE